MPHPNEELLRNGYAAFSTGDMDAVKTVLAGDIVWHVPGKSLLSGDYKGIDEVFGFFGNLIELTGGKFSIEVHDVLANDEHGVVLVRSEAEREGKKYTGNSVHVHHIKGGQSVEYWDHPMDLYAQDEFWS